MDARSAAVGALVEVYARGRSLSAVLGGFLDRVPGARDRALTQDLCYGVLRWSPRLEAIARELLRKPPGRRDTDVYCLVLIGLYQLIYTRIPPHAAVAESVNTVERLGKAWARGLINAVLRRFQRESAAILARVDAHEPAACAHPAWLLERIKRSWPAEWRAVVAAGNARPPMCLRVNRLRGSRADYLRDLARAGISARPAVHGDMAVVLERPMEAERLPGFRAGRVSVQDAAAQLAAGLLDVQAGQRVLDACAAPGGKTTHILELRPDLAEMVAVDQDAERLRRLGDNLGRLGLSARLVCADACDPAAWWDGRRFDRILVDAPCSGTGVIRRHPDIKRLRRPRDIGELAARQRRLLEAAWAQLAVGGMLLYATCSIIPEENEDQIVAFLQTHADASERGIDAPWGRAVRAGRQILPGEHDMDGFYYARLEKRAAT